MMLLPSPQQMTQTHSSSPKKKNAKFYTLADETALLKFLSTRKVSAGMNFSQSDWIAAAATLNRDTIKTDGELRTFESYKAKYRQLKSIYDVVKAVRSNSGWKWDDEKGADITLANKGAWDDYVADHPKAVSFRNKGWVHLALFDVLGSAPPKGSQDLSIRISEGVRASQGPSVAGSSQPTDTQGPEEREDGPQSQSQSSEAPLKSFHVFRASEGPSAGSSKPADTQGPEEREDGPQPQSQAGEAPPKGFHAFRASQGPSDAGSSKLADTQGLEEREDSPLLQPQSQAGEAPPKGLHFFRASQCPSAASPSKPSETQGPEEREDSPPPQSQSQAGDAPHKGLHFFRASQGPSVTSYSKLADTRGPEERKESPPLQSQSQAPHKGHRFFRASQDPSVTSFSKPADTPGPKEREDSPPLQSQSQAGDAQHKGLHFFRASQGPSVAGSFKLADTQGPEEHDTPPWVTIESEAQSQIGEENVSNDEGKLSPPLAMPAPSKRKRTSNTSPTTRKKPRVSASTQAFGDLTAAFHHTATVIEKAFETNVPTSLKRKTDTMKLAIEREKDWLTKRQMALLLDLFEKEPIATEGYQLLLDDDELRREWICIKLQISLD